MQYCSSRTCLLTVLLGWLVATAMPLAAANETSAALKASSQAAALAFVPSGQSEFQFNTGVLRGKLRAGGKSVGLSSLVHIPSGVMLDRGYGIFSHYRVFSSHTRYGVGAWDWPSTAKLLPEGAVEVHWPADDHRPFAMTAVYRWSSPTALDLETMVKPQKDLPQFESFLASYFQERFSNALVYVQAPPPSADKPALLPAEKSFGDWQMFPRDPAVLALINDGRWQLQPNPVQWTIMPRLAAPLAVRRESKTGLAALLMAPAEACFAIATPYQTEGHYSLYLSLFGRDLKAGEVARASARLLVASALSDEQILETAREYLATLKSKR